MCNIICKMKYNINKAIGYINTLAGLELTPLPTLKENIARLPIAISGSYNFVDVEFDDTRITLVEQTGSDESTPLHLTKHQKILTDIFGHPVVFVLNVVPSYNLTRLTRARVNFIVPEKIIFIPSLLLVLRNIKDTVKLLPDLMPPVAQLIVLYHIEICNLNGCSTVNISEKTNLAYPTINVALRWLESHGFVTMTGGKQKYVQFPSDCKTLWENVCPMMTSPVERILYTDINVDEFLTAGETAMGHYTMLAEPAKPVIAITKGVARQMADLFDKQFGSIKVEVWKYDPKLLSADKYVDSLSLYLSLRDSDDERVQMECDNLINDMKW